MDEIISDGRQQQDEISSDDTARVFLWVINKKRSVLCCVNVAQYLNLKLTDRKTTNAECDWTRWMYGTRTRSVASFVLNLQPWITAIRGSHFQCHKPTKCPLIYAPQRFNFPLQILMTRISGLMFAQRYFSRSGFTCLWIHITNHEEVKFSTYDALYELKSFPIH